MILQVRDGLSRGMWLARNDSSNLLSRPIQVLTGILAGSRCKALSLFPVSGHALPTLIAPLADWSFERIYDQISILDSGPELLISHYCVPRHLGGESVMSQTEGLFLVPVSCNAIGFQFPNTSLCLAHYYQSRYPKCVLTLPEIPLVCWPVKPITAHSLLSCLY
jgi:hypothetical protein